MQWQVFNIANNVCVIKDGVAEHLLEPEVLYHGGHGVDAVDLLTALFLDSLQDVQHAEQVFIYLHKILIVGRKACRPKVLIKLDSNQVENHLDMVLPELPSLIYCSSSCLIGCSSTCLLG